MATRPADAGGAGPADTRDPLCPVAAVRETAAFVAVRADSVRVDSDAIAAFCDDVAASVDVASLRKDFEWEACGWHFSDGGPLTCQYVFVLDSLNFCFWPSATALEYEHLASGLRDALVADPAVFSAPRLAVVTTKELEGWFPGQDVPNSEERALRLRELGAVLLRDFDGDATSFAAAAGGSAAALVRLLVEKLPGFRDTVVYKGRLVHFYKRAQILAADLWAAFGRRSTGEGHYAIFFDVACLTMFADYRVPQILRHVGVLRYSEQLAGAVDAGEGVAFGSDAETEIRAATVVAVEAVRGGLAERGVDVLSVEVDWLLWNRGERSLGEMAPHHRTLTIYY